MTSSWHRLHDYILANRQACFAAWPALIMISDHSKITDPCRTIQALPSQSMVILRDYDHPCRASYAMQLAKTCHAHHIKILIAGDTNLALAVKAQGVHFSSHQHKKATKFKRNHPQHIVSMAVHNQSEHQHALDACADLLLLSPLFPTQSHPGAPALSKKERDQLITTSSVPVYGLGGIDSTTLPSLFPSSLAGIAGISLFSDIALGD